MPNPPDTEESPSPREPRPHGLLVIDKPPGPTSYDCIRTIKRTCGLSRRWKIGHLGTLDPFASGVLIVALGQAVRYAEFALQSKKRYRARLYLGEETDTLDPTGVVVATAPVPSGWKDRLAEIAARFTGNIRQVPPVFSAKHVGGRRSYKAARKGEKVELEPTQVTVYSLEFGEVGESWGDFTSEVSGGTYLRALGRDIAKALGTVGHLVGLERLSVGPFTDEKSIPLQAFEVGGIDVLEHHLLPIDPLLSHLPTFTVRPGREGKLIHGNPLTPDDTEGFFSGTEESAATVRILDIDGRFRALGRFEGDPPRIIPFKPWPMEETTDRARH